MRTLHLFYILCIALVLPASLCAHEHAGWTVTNFNNENGLPQNSISFVQMDNDGYLWIATQGGIVRYDGQRFRLFNNSNSALERNRYVMFGKDSKGRIYCTDDDLKTAFYDNSNGFSKPVALPSMISAADGGLLDLNRIDMGKLAPLTNKFTHSAYPDITTFYHATGKGKGFIVWKYTIAGYVSNGRVRWTDSIDSYYGSQLAIGCVGDKLCYINKNREFVLLDTNGVRSYQKIPFAVPWHKLQQYILAVAFFSQAHQTLLNVDGDIYEVKLSGGNLVFHHLVAARDISFITSVRYYPEQGLLIIGSNTQGLFLFKKRQLTAVGKNYWESANAFYALAPYGKNEVIATTGLLPGGRVVPAISDGLNRYSILRDHKGHYWYGSGFDLLETDNQFHILKRVPLLREELKCVQEDETGTIWLSQGQREFGRVVADTFQRYPLDSLAGSGIKTIISILPAGNQTFWLVGYRLCIRLDVKHQRQRIYHEFDNMELRSAYIDKKGNLWLGSYGNGYFLLRNGRFIKMPEDKAHALSNVHSFLEDNKGFIWMTTNNGLFQCAINDLYDYASGKTEQVYQHYYGKESGLKTSEFNGGCTPSGLKLDNGSFAFPSMDGVVLFHPDSIKAVLPKEKVFIEQILLDGKPAQKNELSKIPPSFKRLTLTVSTPYFGNPRNLNIQYHIEGLDDDWYPLGDNKEIVLNRLKYGHYKLVVRKMAGFGTNNFIKNEIPLIIKPFFYQTWWFRILVCMSIILLIIGCIKMRFRYLIRQKNLLELAVKDRTQSLVYYNKLLEKFTVMIAHDLQSPLHFLSKVAGHLRKKLGQNNLPEMSRTAEDLKNTTDQVYQFVAEFNLWASTFQESFSLHKTSFILNELLQELALFFKEMLRANDNKLVILTPANYCLHTDRGLLKIILRNILDNANKHSQGCHIQISAETEKDGFIAITFTDTGEGMNKDTLQKIQERIAHASTADAIEQNSRMGYQMIIDFAIRINAELKVASERGKGTSVTLYVAGGVSEQNPGNRLV